MGDILVGRDVLGALLSFRCHFEGPGNDESNRKAEDDDEHDESNDPARNLEERKNLRRDLDQKPGDNSVGNCDSVDVAPLQLGEKLARVHCFESRVTSAPLQPGAGKPVPILISCHDTDVRCPDGLDSRLFLCRRLIGFILANSTLSHVLSATMPVKKTASARLPPLESFPTRNRT